MTESEGKTILCPVDFSDHTIRTLKEATFQAEKSGGRLVVLHVLNERTFEEIDRWQGRVQSLGVDIVAEAVKSLGDEREEMLRSAVKESGADRVPHKSIITRGRPAEEILRLAEDEKADLIVMGVRGRRALTRSLFVGSRADKVFHRAQCSVLFVR